MSGMWVFKDGVNRLVRNDSPSCWGGRRKVLVYVPTNEVITSHGMLGEKLGMHGWERYQPAGDAGLRQFHKPTSIYLISLPKRFRDVSSVHMYDIAVKCRDVFEVRDFVSESGSSSSSCTY